MILVGELSSSAAQLQWSFTFPRYYNKYHRCGFVLIAERPRSFPSKDPMPEDQTHSAFTIKHLTLFYSLSRLKTFYSLLVSGSGGAWSTGMGGS